MINCNLNPLDTPIAVINLQPMKFSAELVVKIGLVAIVLLIIALLLVPDIRKTMISDELEAANSQELADLVLPDGFYLVSRQSQRREELLPVSRDERVVAHYKTYAGSGQNEPTMYLVVSKSPQVPISLSSPPKSGEIEDGKKAVMLDFSEEAAAKLERFSQDNIGGALAVIIGGKVVTRHKIRVAISGGKLQVSCCGAGACEQLMSELSDNYSEEK